MKLIVDCGSTKAEWSLVDSERAPKLFQSEGMNALMLSRDELVRRVGEIMPGDVASSEADTLYFYGAGCVSEEICIKVGDAFKAHLPSLKHIEVNTDLLGAARALLGNDEGIACILGTGSNSCLYDGEKIVENVSPLGYILGDEGSGAVMGKLLVADILKCQLPEDIRTRFYERYGLDRLSIIQRVYREGGANRFLASFAPFLSENIERMEIREIVAGSFKSFINRNLRQYPDFDTKKINFVGSIAFHFSDILKEACLECGCQPGVILKSPMEGLITYHVN